MSVKTDVPSRTAYAVALSRAAHQLFDSPRIFEDPLAVAIINARFFSHPGARLRVGGFGRMVLARI